MTLHGLRNVRAHSDGVGGAGGKPLRESWVLVSFPIRLLCATRHATALFSTHLRTSLKSRHAVSHPIHKWNVVPVCVKVVASNVVACDQVDVAHWGRVVTKKGTAPLT